MDSESEDDEILTAVPLLLTEDNTICDTSFAEISSDTSFVDIPIVNSYIANKQSVILPGQSVLVTQVANESVDKILNECSEDFQILPESLYLNQTFYYPSDFSLVVSQCYNGFHCTTTRNPERLFLHAEIPKECKSKNRTTTGRATPLSVLIDKRINHPAAYSKNFINHRSPVLPPKTGKFYL